MVLRICDTFTSWKLSVPAATVVATGAAVVVVAGVRIDKVRVGDVVLAMGAGSIGAVAGRLVQG